jgi:hypothetical protein
VTRFSEGVEPFCIEKDTHVLNKVCTVNSTTGDVTPVTAGTCTITASQASDGTYSAGSATVSVTIVAGPQPTVTVSASPTDLSYLGSTTLAGGGGAGTGTFTYAKTSGNCTISGAVLSYGTAHAGETCSVTATRSATTGKYTATTSAALVINVVKAAQSTAVVVPTGRTVGYSNTVDLATFSYSGGNGTGAYVFSTSTANCSITGTVLTSFAFRYSLPLLSTHKQSSKSVHHFFAGLPTARSSLPPSLDMSITGDRRV